MLLGPGPASESIVRILEQVAQAKRLTLGPTLDAR